MMYSAQAMVAMLTRVFRVLLATRPSDLLPAVYLTTNTVSPAHEGRELGIGDAILIKVRHVSSQILDQGRTKSARESLKLEPELPDFFADARRSDGAQGGEHQVGRAEDGRSGVGGEELPEHAVHALQAQATHHPEVRVMAIMTE